ncbi:beta-ketoacyl synthase N-terminal-like domain-containing protein [Apibacter sp. B2966]|uniref:beta-ketoacyl synthase N-terminal-like domain-containing protein n=1 Tax=Apibacter sp. B2966 TaxID=2656761 RepID=UPI0014078A15|nr:beta-ketoacyl synthase N-terminal-like domain-containing protein [Apibacter sp. B2966]QII72324.1 hypothetical protein G8C43_05900 [Apibacter sp. B2966]
MKKNRVFITGVGLVSPYDKTESEKLISENEYISNDSFLKKIKQFDYSNYINTRLKKKIDDFSMFGMSAAEKALNSNRWEKDNLKNFGIYIGNNLGGWKYIEQDILDLHYKKEKFSMSPYVATAWFPAALQGQISIKFRIKGLSKTYSLEDVAGIQSIGYAVEAIKNNRINKAICGASECLSSTYMKSILYKYNEYCSKGYFGKSNILSYSEGAVFFILEDFNSVKKRESKTLGEVLDFIDVFRPEKDFLDKTYSKLFQLLEKEQILFILDGRYKKEEDIIKDFVSTNNLITKVSIVNFQNLFGYQFSVSGLMELGLLLSENNIQGTIDIEKFTHIIIQRVNPNGNLSLIKVKIKKNR